jgi:hypothetical protein
MQQTPQKKGINFKLTPGNRMLFVEPETFFAYLQTLPKTTDGLVLFHFQYNNAFTKTHLFANLSPEAPMDMTGYVAPFSGIDFLNQNGKKLFIIDPQRFKVYLEGVPIGYKTWKAFVFKSIPKGEQENYFATVKPYFHTKVYEAKAMKEAS